MREVVRVRRRYHYDAVDRLERVELGAGDLITYSFDAAGNRVAEVVEPATSEPESERQG